MKKFDPKLIENILALTPMQEGMLFHYLQDPQSGLYFEQLCLGISGMVDVKVFEKAWHAVTKCNEMLRTVFRWEKLENPTQIILKEHSCNVIWFDLADKGDCQKVTVLNEIKNSDRLDSFDLTQVPFRVILCKLAEKQYEMVISSHHILFDGWSTGIILKEFFMVYHWLQNGGQWLKLPAKTSFKEFIKWIQIQDRGKQERFWREYLMGFDSRTELSLKREKRDGVTGVGKYGVVLGREINDALAGFVKENRVTVASVFYTAWGILLQKFGGCEDVILGTTVSGRSARIKGIEDMVGLFINTIPLRVQSAPGEKVLETVLRIDKELQAREEFESTPLVDIGTYCPVENGGSLFDTIMVIENYPLDNRLVPADASLCINSFAAVEMTHYDLTVAIIPAEDITMSFIFHRELFDDNAVENLARVFMGIVRKMVENPEVDLFRLEIISREEKERLLSDFNNSYVEYPPDMTIHGLFEEQASRTPDSVGLVGPAGQVGQIGQVALSYKKLNEQAGRLAGLLIEKGVRPDMVVGMMVERSIEMIICLLGIMKAGGAYLPIDPAYPRERIEYMLKDSGTKVLIINKSEIRNPKFETNPNKINSNDQNKKRNSRAALVLNFENLNFDIVSSFDIRISNFNSSNLAYLIYTSGSTGKPKGVMLEHRNLVNLLKFQFKYTNLDCSRVLQFATICFDISFQEIFSALLSGGQLFLVNEETRTDIPGLFKLIDRNRIGTLFLPISFLKLIFKEEEYIKLIPLCIKHIQSAGEQVVISASFRNFLRERKVFLHNHYGPAETHVVTALAIDPEGEIPELPSIGKPIQATGIFIMDKGNHLLPAGAAGELWIGGAQVGRGYLNRPELTDEKFKINNEKFWEVSEPFYKKVLTRRRQRLYKTGDLARRLPDGNIEFLGRIDHQVKIRGFRVELGEIESRLSNYPEIKECVIMARVDGKGDGFLCAYVVVTNNVFSTSELREFLAQELPDYMIPAYFVQIDSIPLMPNGKIDRKVLPEPKFETGREFVAPCDEIEKKLGKIWAEVLQMDESKIGVLESFFELGGHSLKAMVLTAKIHREFEVKVPLAEVFKRMNIRGLAQYIRGGEKERCRAIELIEKKWFYPLSSAQKRLYFLQLMEETGTGYNMFQVMRLEGHVDVEKLENTFRKIIQRHESFRTAFERVNDEVVQRVYDSVEFEIECFDHFIHSFIRPFGLSNAPLLRVGLVKLAEREFLLMVDMHHIISDGVSLVVLIREFMDLYDGRELPLPRLQYKDYAEWEKRGQELIARQEAFWLKEFGEFEDGIPVLDLPLDYERPRVQCFEGSAVAFDLDSDVTGALNGLALKRGATLYMVLLAVFDIFLAKLSNREMIVVGTPTAGRDHADVENIVGMFVNTLVLKNVPCGEKCFLLFLEEVKEKTLNAFANQGYPYGVLVEKVMTDRDTGRNPLFDTMFALQNLDLPIMEIPGLKLEPFSYEQRIAKFDLTLECTESDGRLSCVMEYCTRLFKRETILRFTGCFKRVIAAVLAGPGEKISGIEIISDDEKRQLLFQFNDTFADYPGDKTIHGLFEEQAARAPDRIAIARSVGQVGLVGQVGQVSLTYRELNDRSNQLAWLLIKKGVLAGNIVGIMLGRSVEMVTGILAILKAGGAYLPIDPGCPEERINYILKDSGALVLIDKKFFGGPGGDFSKKPPGRRRHFYHSNLAYIIYTSGSTGRPKGVMIPHGAVVNRLYFVEEKYRLDEHDVVLQKTNYTFDVSVCELFRWILPGARLCLFPVGGENQPEVILECIVKYNVTTIDFVPSMLKVFLDFIAGEGFAAKLRSLRWVFTGAEVVRPELVAMFNKLLGGIGSAQLINAYGPTEATVDVTCFNCPGVEAFDVVPIGKPMANVQVFILDKVGHLQPIGVSGELCIGGASLAVGYLNNPELTCKKFKIINEKFLEVSEPFYKKVLTRRRQRIYKTGDLARWLSDGNIEFLGRIDEQVKIRGFRIELGEIEAELMRHEAVKKAVVAALESGNGDKYLCGYIVAPEIFDVSVLKGYLAGKMPGYMIPTFFVQLEKIPLTAGGKVNRNALPIPTGKTGSHYAAPQNDIEKKLVEIWSEVLGTSSSSIGIDDNFFELGGHSLKATILAAKLHKSFEVKIPLVEIFKTPFIRDIARVIGKSQKSEFVDLLPVEEKDFYELSFNQKRLWFLQQMAPGSSAFNMPGKILLEHPVEAEWIEKTLARMCQRHEGFRTGFKVVNGEPVQYITKEAGIVLNKVDLSRFPGLEKQQARNRIFYELAAASFDLTQVPLFRAGLLKLAHGIHEFIFNMHHIISDGLSMEILKDEFSRLYDGCREGREVLLEPVKLHYKDFAVWHNRQLADPLRSESSLRSWRDKLENGVPILELPGDFSAGNNGNDRTAATWRLMIGNELKGKLKELAGATNTTLFMMLFSAYLLLLYRLSGREEVVCSLIDSGREHPSLYRVIGFFINSLIFKTTVIEEEPFLDFLQRTGRDVLDVFQHRSYPLELVFEQLNMKYPDIPVSFNLLNMQDDSLHDELMAFTPHHLDNHGEAKFVMEPYLCEFKNGIEIHWVYQTAVFKAETVAYIAGAYLKTLEEISENPSLPVNLYRILPAPDVAHIKGNRVRPVNEFREFKKEDTRQSIPGRFESIVKSCPDKVAVKVGAAVMTYNGLNCFANRVAALLSIVSIGDRPSGIAALLFDRSIEMLAAVMGVLKAGKTYMPLDPSYPAERLAYMLKDSQAGFIITGNDHANLATVLKNAAAENIEIINITRDAVGKDQNPSIRVSPGDLAYILYTSGSTGQPKGVMQSHGHVLHFARVYANALHIHPGDRLTLFSSYCFDAAKMDIFGALLNGATLYPFDIKKEESLSSLPHWLAKEKITVFHAIPTVYRYFIDQLGSLEKDRFAYLRFIVLGGEAVYKKDVDNYKRYFPDHCLFINGLGPTESTVTLQYFIDKETEISKLTVPVGFPVEDTQVFIVNDKGEEARVFEVGELVYKSDYLALGYLNNPEITRERFGPQITLITQINRIKKTKINKSFSGGAGGRLFKKAPLLYRTGDLGRRLPDGMIEYVGRKDFQVKVRGYRIELSEIEGALDRLEGVKKGVAVCRQDAGGESYLIAYYQVEPGFGVSIDEDGLVRQLQGSLPAYMMPNAFYRLEEFPLTATGKIDRKALVDRIVPGELKGGCHTPPRDALEAKLAEIWSEVLGAASASIGIDDNFFERGGHSLKATVLAAKVHRDLNVKIPLAEVFKSPSIRLLSKYIKSIGINRYAALEPVEKREYYALSPAQKRLYVLQQFDLNSTAYNLSSILPLGKEIETDRLESVLKSIIARHESLRTSFERVNDEVVQRVHEEVEIKVFAELFSKSDPPEAILKSFIRPFDLSCAPLLRVGIVKWVGQESFLIVDMHHIVSDGTSQTILWEDFMSLYNGLHNGLYNVMALRPLRIQYKDFALWQNRFLESEELKAQKGYWLELFKGEIPCLDLVADYKRPEVFTQEGGHYGFKLEKEEAQKFKALGVRDGGTIYMNMLAALNTLFYKYTGQADIIIGSGVAGRRHADLQRMVGMFVNTLAMRNYPQGEISYEDFLKEVITNSVNAFENQDVPFEDLVEALAVARNPSRNPVFDMMMVVQNFRGAGERVLHQGLAVENPPNPTAKFDMTFFVREIEDEVYIDIEYYRPIFKPETIERLAVHFKNIIGAVVEKPGIKLRDIEIVSREEKHRVLIEFNETACDYPREKTLHELFEEQVERAPDRIAIVGGTAVETLRATSLQTTYRQLNEQAGRIAGLLVEKGVLADDIVGIMMGRSIEMIIGILAILKTGGAYLPIDPEYPRERVEYILRDSGARILINKSEIRNPKFETNPNNQNPNDQNKNRHPGAMLVLNFEHLNFDIVSNFDIRISDLNSSNLAYIIYTSGTTGRPKGVMIEHRAVVNLCFWHNRYYRITAADHATLYASFGFDAAVWELFPYLIKGAEVYLLDDAIKLDIEQLHAYYEQMDITVSFLPTQFCEQFMEMPNRSLRLLLTGGDKLRKTANKGKYDLYNNYGPTENTVVTTAFKVCEWEDNIPIGTPVDNAAVYILARESGLPQPVGVGGELCIAGVGLARGYLNQVELTCKKLKIINDKLKIINGSGALRADFHHSILYCTGDLGRWLPDGNIEFLGRIDNQVKIRGFRIEVGEIEAELMKHKAVGEAVVVALDNGNGDKYLCGYIVTSENFDVSELKGYLAGKMPGYMIPAYFVKITEVPMTPNGKIDRKALPAPVASANAGYVSPRNKLERELVEIWTEVLGGDAPIGIDDNFFERGGHSLKATLLAAKIHKAANVKVPLAEIFKAPRIRDLSEYIKDMAREQHVPIMPAEEKEYYPLSPAQKRLYILQQLTVASTSYNLPYAIPLADDIAKEKLEPVFQTLLARHESLRTSFETINQEPVQRIHKAVEFSIRDYDYSGMGEPFDLSKAPLMRAAFLNAAPGGSILLLDMHHIITDGTSQEILTKEFSALLAGQSLPLPGLRYRDYSEWYFRTDRRETIKRQETYWLKQFAGEVPLLELPTDYPRPAVQRFEGQSKWFRIAKAEMETLKKLALAERATLFMVLESLLAVLLSRLSNQEDILVGTPAAGRGHADLQNVTGMFVNMLVLWNHLPGALTFKEFLNQVKEKTLEAFENQDYPFEELVEHAAVNRDLGRNPLFDVVFALQNTVHTAHNSWARAGMGETETKTSKFDLTLTAIDGEEEPLFRVEYSTRLFTEATIERIINCFKQVVREVIANPAKQVSAIEIIPPAEKQQILFEFNETGVEYPVNKTIHGLFEEQAAKTPDCIAVFCHGHASTTRTNTDYNCLTYRQLNEQANLLAGLLIEKGVEPGTIVGIMMERSLEMIISIIGILKAGGAYLPLNPENPEERVEYILRDSNARILINKSEIRNPKFESPRREHPIKNINDQKINVQNKNQNFGAAFVLNFEFLNFDIVSNFDIRISDFNSSNLAYLIYTSGSTGNPKGVPIKHANVSPLLHWGYRLGIGVKDRTIQDLSYYFDWSVWEIFITLTTGAALYMTSEDNLPAAPGGVAFINRHGITILHATPTQYQYIIKTPALLGTLKYLFIGAEKLTYDLVERSFASVGNDCRVFNMYGPTEATIISAVMEIHRESLTQFKSLACIPIGRAAGNTIHFILDKYRNVCPITIAGELYINGSGIAMGYLNNPELTSEKFINFHHSSFDLPRIHHSILYCTGDLARWLVDGNIEFLGRIDNQVKIRGLRIELGEIESRLLKHAHIKDAVVIDRKDENGDSFLIAYFVPTQPVDAVALRNDLSQSMPNYMIPSHFVPIETIPLTPNGKLDRGALPVPFVNSVRSGNERDYQAPLNQVEIQLTALWREVLKVAEIGINDNFFEWGGHSLKAMTLIVLVKKEFQVDVPLRVIFEKPTIREQAQYINEFDCRGFAVVEPVEKKEYYPLSAAQRRLFILDRVQGQEIIYNLPGAVTVYGELSVTKVENALTELIRRHESLRTSFHIIADFPVQRVHKSVEITKVFAELFSKSDPPEAIIRNFLRSFDLSQAPLLRAGLLKIEKATHILIVDLHHIIADGVSVQLFINEFCRLYAGERLEKLTVQYKDFAQWQEPFLQSGQLAKQKNDWLARFSGEIPVLTMPLDFPRPSRQSFEGDKIDFEIDEKLTGEIRQVGESYGATLYMTLLSIFTILLSRYSGQEDIIVGSPSAGRRYPGVENIIGMFVNTLVMRNFPVPGKCFIDFLAEVKQNSLAAFENQDYPFDDLVDDLAVKRDAGRNPLFDVMFALQNIEAEEISVQGLVFKPYKLQDNIAKFDISLHCWEDHDRLYGGLRYGTKLFKKETMQRFVSHFENIIKEVVQDSRVKLSDIKMLSEAEAHCLLYDFNKTGTDYPRDKTISQIFAEQVETLPDSIALVGAGPRVCPSFSVRPVAPVRPVRLVRLSYKELNERAGKLAGILIQKGVGPDTIIGLMMDRSLEMIIGIMAILKSGGAFLPIDPEYPQERIDYMLKDSGAQILINKSEIRNPKFETNPNDQKINDRNKNQNFGAAFVLNFEHLDLSSLKGRPCRGLSNFDIRISDFNSSNLAYVIYTSGSTGTPKGVMVQNNNLVNYIHWFVHKASFTKRDSVVLTTTISFDAGYTYIFGALLKGGSLHIIPKETYLIPGEFLAYISKQQIAFLKLIPSLFSEIINSADFSKEKLHSVRLIMLGGEAIKPSDVAKAHGFCPHLSIMNHYGPTEVTIGCIARYIDFSRFEEYKNTPTIGKPIDNNRAYILNRHMTLLPIGVPGELYLSGEGVARGYLNQVELTCEKLKIINDKLKIINGSGALRADLNAFGDEENCHHSTLYYTGDLARWLADGNIEFLGRVDHQVKIRGHRIETAEIEQVLLAHPGIKECVAAVGKDDDGNHYLAAYYVAKGGAEENISPANLHEYLAKKLPNYMIPSFFIPLAKFPLTFNGKIDRKALPKPSGSNAIGKNYEAPANAVEESLVKVWQEILKVDRIGAHDNFFQLGGDSIKAIQVSSRLQKYGLKLESRDFFANPVVNEVAKHITPMDRKIPQDLVTGPVHLTPIQRRFFERNPLNRHHYNQAVMLYRESGFDEKITAAVFKEIVAHHDALRIVYRFQANTIIQENRGLEGELFHFEVMKIDSNVDIESQIEKEANRLQAGIDLTAGPLVHLGLFKTTMGDHLLIIVHHLVVDGISWRILLEDFTSGYRQMEKGEEIKFQPKTDSFKYWSEKLTEYAESEKILAELNYWKRLEEIEIHSIPVDFEIPAEERTAKNKEIIAIELAPQKAEMLRSKAYRDYGVDMHDLLLAALAMALKQWRGVENIAIDLEGHGREAIIQGIDISRTVGWYTSRYPALLDLKKAASLPGMIVHVKETLRSIPGKGIGYGILRYLTMGDKKEGFKFSRDPRVSFSYLGQFQAGNIDSDIFTISPMKTGDSVSPGFAEKYMLNINGLMSAEGQLHLSFSYNKQEYAGGGIEELKNLLESNLSKIIAQ